MSGDWASRWLDMRPTIKTANISIFIVNSLVTFRSYGFRKAHHTMPNAVKPMLRQP
jgi:hypothetical protein